MRGRLFGKLKQNKAFTLMETLIVVGITVILLGISMIGLSQFVSNLKMTELDGYAKSIYLEAQNQLIAEKVEGGMPKYAKLLEQEMVGNRLTVAPHDYAENDTSWNELYYIGKNDEYSEALIPEYSYIYNTSGDYIIEFNPQTGVIYGVFYWEEDSALDYVSDIANLTDRTKESRTASRIGYYGGIQSELLGDNVLLNQSVELVNGEELYIKISYPITENILRNFNSALEIKYEIKDKTGQTWSQKIEAGTINAKNDDNIDVVSAARSVDVYILLDSMETGQSIADLTASMKNEDGEEIDCDLNLDDAIEITVYSSMKDVADVPTEDTTVAGNGLYANATGEYIYSANAEEDTLTTLLQDNTTALIAKDDTATRKFDVVEVNTIRHMRNLNMLNVHNGGSNIASDIVISFTSKIDFANNNFKWTFTKNERGEIIAIDYDDGTVEAEGEIVVEDASNPLSTFEAIENDVFKDEAYTVYVEGNNSDTTKNSALQNFVVNAEADNAGIWSSTNKVSFCNVMIEDITIEADGYNNVGSLAGAVSNGEIINCGTYLTNAYKKDGVSTYFAREDAISGEYDNEMDRRYNSYQVTGNDNVGGLVGRLEDVNVAQSFAAIKVEATGNNIGGFAGNANGVNAKATIHSCYSSGDVYGNKNVGGFVGNANNLSVGNYEVSGEGETTMYGVYTTSNVHATEYFGGFVGVTTNSNYKQCTVYGAVNANGANVYPNEVHGGGFVGSSVSGNTYDASNASCTYLTQTGQNDKVTNLSNLIVAKDYNDCLATTENSLLAGTTFAYSKKLLTSAFPFGKHWEAQKSHYGNWKEQYVIDTSLVYYEKYEDNTYGYYCMTYMTGNENQWLLDSLKDKVVKEDGYAILTKYNLQYVEYELQVGSILQSDIDSAKTEELKEIMQDYMQNGTLHVTNADTSLKQIKQEGTITFKACKDDTILTGDDANSFVVTGLYLYRLPYDLQCTERYYVENFYDRLTLKTGVVADSTPNDTTDDISVIEDLTFFYCPHFAKTAFNPNVNDEDSLEELNYIKKDNPSEVAVRSARQLNALGRNPYYWNYKGGATKLAFEQEVDIDFGKYVDTYCGEEFNLLAFDQPYSNQPIGQYNGDVYSSFANQYDGNYNKIIDYCVKSSNQYVGLFGEIYVDCDVDHDGVADEDTDGNGLIDDWDSDGDVDKDDAAIKAAYHQIQNVVMVVSGNNDGSDTYLNQSDPMQQNNAGYIIGTFLDDASLVDNARNRTGVGALIGSDYTIGATDDESATNVKAFTVYNCASAGYKVEYHVGEYTEIKDNGEVVYHIGSVPTGKQTPVGIAVGGLVGYSRANFSNCSATNDVKLVAAVNYVTETHTGINEYRAGEYISYGDKDAVFLGGFVGSHYFGTAKYSYAGGTIDVDFMGDAKYVFRMRVGGFCPGWLDAPGLADSGSGEKVRYETIYSYAQLSEDVWDIYESSDEDASQFKYLIPAVGRLIVQMKEVDISIRTGFLSWKTYTRMKWDTTSVDGARWGVRVPGMSMYLTSVYNDTVMEKISSEAKTYFQQNGSNKQTCRPGTYDEMMDFNTIVSIVKGDDGIISIDELHKANDTYTENGDKNESQYPFPAFTFEKVDGEIKYNHYGDFPARP